MDIAKIRKKAQEKEGGKEGKPREDTPVPGEPLSHEEAKEETHGEVHPESTAVPEEAVQKQDEERQEKTAFIGGDSGVGGEKNIELLTFSLSHEEFAFRLSEVEEIIKPHKTTRVPTLPDYVTGITSLRGKIIPVIDLKKRLALEDAGTRRAGSSASGQPSQTRREKILILSGPHGMIGANVDHVLGVVRFPESKVLEPPAHLSGEELAFLDGVVILEKRFISIIRPEEALSIEVR